MQAQEKEPDGEHQQDKMIKITLRVARGNICYRCSKTRGDPVPSQLETAW